MPRICIFFILLLSLQLHAQEKTTFYDFHWKPCEESLARYYAVTKKTDSGWLRYEYYASTGKVLMKGLFSDAACNEKSGHFIWLYENGKRSGDASFINNKRRGVCVSWHHNGVLADSAFYTDNLPGTLHLRWHDNGFLMDSIRMLTDTTRVQISWFDNGAPSEAGYYLYGRRQGKWEYYHKNGGSAAKIEYDMGIPIEYQHFDETGKELMDTSKLTRGAEFSRGGQAGWMKYIYRNITWPRNLKFATSAEAALDVNFTITDEGKMTNVWVGTSLHPEFDEAVISAVRSSPDWKPALDHGRRVKQQLSVVVTFSQQ